MKIRCEYKTDSHAPVVAFMVGLPGSGKSTVAAGLRINRSGVKSEPVVVSTDALRKELAGSEENFSKDKEVFEAVYANTLHAAVEGKDVVYDATNLRRRYRKSLIDHLKKRGIDCQFIALMVNTDIDECKRRNAGRERKVPENVIENMAKGFEPISENEGFSRVIRVKEAPSNA